MFEESSFRNINVVSNPHGNIIISPFEGPSKNSKTKIPIKKIMLIELSRIQEYMKKMKKKTQIKSIHEPQINFKFYRF